MRVNSTPLTVFTVKAKLVITSCWAWLYSAIILLGKSKIDVSVPLAIPGTIYSNVPPVKSLR